jgi:tetratricopeptide (TPR) repeat protein
MTTQLIRWRQVPLLAVALCACLYPWVQAADTPRADRLTARPRSSAPPGKALAVGAEVQTTVGEQRRLMLPGGAVLFVNQHTTVRLDKEHQLSLSSGEILIEEASLVQGTNASAFVVKTARREFTGSGAKFRVRIRDEGAELVVIQGEVRVRGLAEPVSAGQRLPADSDQPVTAARASYLLDWTRELVLAAEAPLVPAAPHPGGALMTTDLKGQPTRLSLRKYHIDVHIEDGFARTTIDQTYFNSEPRRLEGTFFFPLPPDASLSRLAMYVDGQLMEGGMTERDHGRTVFETIVRKQRDPALLEWVDGHTFKIRVFPLEGRQEKRIILSYTQKLPAAYGRTQYRFPAGHSLGAVAAWSLHVRVKGGAGLGWSSDSHPTLLKAGLEGGDLVLDGEVKLARLDRDLRLDLVENKADVEADATRFSTANQDGARYLLLRHRPLLTGEARRPPHGWVFLVETAGDRDPLLARTQIEIVRALLGRAGPEDAFAVLTCANRVEAFQTDLRPATAENVQAAITFLERAHLVGGLDLKQGFTAAQPFLKTARNPFLVHIGSGLPGLGERRPEMLVREIPDGAHYVGVGVGKRRGGALIKSLAERTGGITTHIDPDESISWRTFELSAALHAPRLLGVKVADAKGRLTFLSGAPALAQGEELWAVARLEAGQGLPDSVIVTGTVDAKPFRRVLPVKEAVGPAEYLPRTWAKLEIERLLVENNTDNKAKIIALSKAMYVMTPYTSLLVLENEAMYAEFKVDRDRKDHWAMYPCPTRVPFVKGPEGKEPSTAKDKPGSKDVLQTIFVRSPSRCLQGTNLPRPDDSGKLLTAWDYFSGGAEGNPYEGRGSPDIQEQIADVVDTTLAFPGPPGSGDGSEQHGPDENALEPMGLFNSQEMDHFGAFPKLVDDLQHRYGTGILPTFAWSQGQDRYSSVYEKVKGVADKDLQRLPGGPPLSLYADPRLSSHADWRGGRVSWDSLVGLHKHLARKGRLLTEADAGFHESTDLLLAHLLGRSQRELTPTDRDGVIPAALIYQRPFIEPRWFRNELFFDLPAHAPGLDTTRADILAVVDAEASADPVRRQLVGDTTPGRIDQGAARLIDQARAADWQAVTIPAQDGWSAFTIVCDGGGRHVFERPLPEGLLERVFCDGNTLLHHYHELGLGARRSSSRFHAAEFAALVPWAVLPAADLARGADLKCLDERTVAIVPHDPANPFQVHMTFSPEGRLVARRVVETPSGKTHLRETYAADGAVALLDGNGKELAVHKFVVRAAKAPNLQPDVKALVLLPLPFRTRQHVGEVLKVKSDGRPYKNLDDNTALALIAANFGASSKDEFRSILRERFYASDRLGFATILTVFGSDWIYLPADKKEFGPDAALVGYLSALKEIKRTTEIKQHPRIGELGDVEDGFLPRLAAFHDLLQRWQSRWEWRELKSEDERALAFVRQNKSSAMGWELLSVMQKRIGDKDLAFCHKYAGCWLLFADVPEFAYAARYEHAIALAAAGDREEARKLLRALHAQALREQVLPPLDIRFRTAFDKADQEADSPTSPAWVEFIRETSDTLRVQKRRRDLIDLAWQCWVFGDTALAQQVFERAFSDLPAGERFKTVLAGMEYLCGTHQFARAEKLLQPLLAEPALVKDASLWRLAAGVADRQGKLTRAVACWEKALELDSEKQSGMVDLALLRWNYNTLMIGQQQLAARMVELEMQPPQGFIDSIVRAADRWRLLDGDRATPCRTAAWILKTAGADELAWAYLTTATALRADEKPTWLDLARKLHQDGAFSLADRAFAEAGSVEPENAQILWERVVNLEQAGKPEAARPLLRKLIDEKWPERFRWVQEEAKGRLPKR